jgi:SAM-dependent methyltransferase
MAESGFDEWIAQRYETLWPELFEKALISATVSVLADLADTKPALEFGVGTGRIALPLTRAGVEVHGIELSPAMVARLRAQPGGTAVDVTVGDFATVTVGEEFGLVYLLRNTITNLTTQAEQVDAFRNAARHLSAGGFFLIENYVPALRFLPPGQTTRVFTTTATHLGYEDYDVTTQMAVSHHWWTVDGELRRFSSTHRYAWPSELDLMAQMAGMTLRERWGGWHREPFTDDSSGHVTVWQKGEHVANPANGESTRGISG